MPNKKKLLILHLVILFFSICSIMFSQIGTEEKLIFFQTNLVIEPADTLLSRIDRARSQGANAVLISDSKFNRFGALGTAGNQWKTQADKLVAGIKARNMKLIINTITTGFNGNVLASNPSLTTGYPIEEQEVQVQNGSLVPVNSANISNGGFENYTGDDPGDWGFQDDPGSNTFIDTQVKRSGNASFRIDPRNGEQARIFRTFSVKPFHNYTLVCWIKTENLTANKFFPLIRDDNNTARRLTNLYMSQPKTSGGRSYLKNVNNLNLDWTEVRIGFNSLDATVVNLGLTVYGGYAGSIWWDDIEIIDSPFLNWINRDDLPTSITKDGIELLWDVNVEMPEDTLLGVSGFIGAYDTQHLAPEVTVISNSQVDEGDILKVSGYHALPTGSNAQVSGAWNNQDWLDKVKQVHQTLYQEFNPDGFLLNYSEIRTGGWEPNDLQFSNSGEALASSIEKTFSDMEVVAPNAEHYFWNDMVDPNHNAVETYYQVNNTLDGSWLTLDPSKVTICTWWEGQKITDKGPLSLSHFADLGFKQIVGGYYDADVTTNFNRWTTASSGIANIVGSMYTTWVKDYTNIEAFADLWWTNCEAETFVNGLIKSDTYTAAQSIYSSGIANSFSEIIFSSNEVTLQEGFAVSAGGLFEINSLGCN